MDVEVDTSTHEVVGVSCAILVVLEHELDVVGHDPAFLLPRAQVPEDDGQVIRTSGQDVSVPDVLC